MTAMLSCINYKTPIPVAESFTIYELVDNDGLVTIGEVVTNQSGSGYAVPATSHHPIGYRRDLARRI